MIKGIFLGVCFFLSTAAWAQVSIGYYPFQSEISVSTNSERLVWGELRIATNTFYGNITTEPIAMVNVYRKTVLNIFGGAGVNFNFFNAISDISVLNGYSLHVGSRIKPFQNVKNIQLIFEVSPYFNKSFDGGLFRTRLGVAYQFHPKKRS